MTNTQLFIAVGFPTLAILVGILINQVQVSSITSRISSLEGSTQSGFNLLTGKVIELVDRVSHLEARIGK